MEWKMPNGSTFHTREILDEDSEFEYTSVTAIIDGTPFAGRLNSRMKDLEPADMLSAIEKVEVGTIYPRCPKSFKNALQVTDDKDDDELYYFKSPSFDWEDTQPGRHFVADRVLSEATLYELLAKNPHPNIAQYHGCEVDEGRIQSICLSYYESNLVEALHGGDPWVREEHIDKWLAQIVSAARHLHKLGYAHNDINAHNICLDKDRNAVLIDFDSAELIGATVVKGQLHSKGRVRQSDERHDWTAIGELDRYIKLTYL